MLLSNGGIIHFTQIEIQMSEMEHIVILLAVPHEHHFTMVSSHCHRRRWISTIVIISPMLVMLTFNDIVTIIDDVNVTTSL